MLTTSPSAVTVTLGGSTSCQEFAPAGLPLDTSRHPRCSKSAIGEAAAWPRKPVLKIISGGERKSSYGRRTSHTGEAELPGCSAPAGAGDSRETRAGRRSGRESDRD